jgi:hypothetical protein
MNVSYQIKVGVVPQNLPNIDALKIDLNVIPIPYLYNSVYEYEPILSQEISYIQVLQQGTYRGQITFYLQEIAPDSEIICPDDFDGISEVRIKASIRLPAEFSDAIESNNTKTQKIRWKREPIVNGKSIEECGFIPGGKGDFTFTLGSLPRFASVGCSIIDLQDCGEVIDPDNSIGCDRDPGNPLFGARSVNWVNKPTNENISGKVHWWCEGFANPKPEGTVAPGCSANNGLVSCYGWPKFIFNVYTYIYEPYVVP